MILSGGMVFSYQQLFNQSYPYTATIAIVCISILFFIFILHRIKRTHSPIILGRIKEELGPKEWEQYMCELVRSHSDVKRMKYNFILGNYNQRAYKKLNQIRLSISAISSDLIELVPSARWLFDNFQMLYREIKKIKTTGTGYVALPILKKGEFFGYPRIYVLTKKMVDISGGYLNEDSIIRMINEYQKKLPLTEKELGVLPEIIGLCILERIIEVSEEIVSVIKIKSKAELFINKNLAGSQGYLDISSLLKKLPEDCNENITFHSHVLYLLRNMSVEDDAIQRYINYHFNSRGKAYALTDIFIEEGKIESRLESNIRTPIESLREINQIDDEKLCEELSVLEHILMKDPDCVYPKMDSESRAMYRAAIEKLSYRYKISEKKIAEECLSLSEQGREDLNCSFHVGTYLIGKGLPVLKAKILNREPPANLEIKMWSKYLAYFFSVLLTLFAVAYSMILLIKTAGDTGIYKYILILVVLCPVLMDISLKITNNLLSRIIETKRIPSLDYMEEIPESARTFVVMPVIISSAGQGIEYLERLHKHYLANKQSNLYFGLLVDYADSFKEHMPEDSEIQDALIKRLDELNKKYPAANQRFSLFIRYRKWNPSEGCYMAWERKRGKIEEFNALLNGIVQENTTFETVLCDKELLETCQYVITLDADSDLTRDGASKLVGMIDHPLNQAVIDSKTGKIRDGYVIVQPSVRNHIENRKRLFPRVYSCQTGVANYSFIISDIYQDLFKESTFVGKGIYNVKAFHKLLYKVIPENSVLSHDLLESCYAKTAFASNVNIMESFPGSVMSFDKREHRWIRGDWQLLPWLFKKDLGFLSKWKIFNNMRASLVPVSKMVFVILTLALFPKALYLCLPILFFNGCWDVIFLLGGIIIHKIKRPKLALVHSKLRKEIGFIAGRTFLDIIFIPSRAHIACDAIIRTLFRLFVSKKHLLMWKSAETVEKSVEDSLKSYFIHMWHPIVPGILLLVLTGYAGIYEKIFYGSIAVAWCLSFLTAYSISRPGNNVNNKKDVFDEEFLIDTARRIWRYFTVFTTRDNNWLCPDNYQIANKKKIAYRTSPTNIGLQFLAILSARDFGFDTLSSLLDYAENILYTLAVIPKWRGHLYNWYDVKTLGVLVPKYISTVDSGNFFASLIAFKNGLLEQINAPVFAETMMTEINKQINLGNTGLKLKDDYETVGDFLSDIIEVREKLNSGEIANKEDGRVIGELTRRINLIEREILEFGALDADFSTKTTLQETADSGNQYARTLIDRIRGLAETIDKMLDEADFSFLFNNKRRLFHIGYNTESQKADEGCYDLMASEALLTSFLSIARGEMPVKHWYKLGRPLALINGIPALVSWSGSMFEYLMPHLLIKSFDGSVLHDSCKAAVIQQMRYAKQMKMPWGISESQYFRFDMDANYQYRAFGVPGLRLQPVYGKLRVIAPYATMLALEWADEEAVKNLAILKKLKAYGDYGYYEAIDFNVPDPVYMYPYCIVKSYMAHHQGMSLVAINNYLNNGIMRSRFHREPIVQATEILLEEKRQTYFISISRKGYTIDIKKRDQFEDDTLSIRYINGVAPRIPAVNYVSNGNYSLLVTSDGDGFSNCKGMMLYRWRADVYADTGHYIYIKDIEKNRVWSATYKPTKAEPDEYRVIFSPHKSEFIRRDGDIGTHTVVSLSPDQNIEIRKITLKNYGNEVRHLEITSYLEVVADSYSAEVGHPAFNKLFIESEYLEEGNVFLSRRRGSNGNGMYVMHMIKSEIPPTQSIEYENDRMRFIGRNNTLQNPAVITGSIPLSNSTGFSSDPIMSLRLSLCLNAEQSATLTIITGTCESKEEALKISDLFSLGYRGDDIIEKFRQQSLMELKYLNITGQQLAAFQSLISPIYYPARDYRGPIENIRRNWKNQSFLWRFGVSGDNSIMLLRVNSINEAAIIRDVLKAFEYMRINRVQVDLIILSEAKHGYMQELTNLLNEMTSSLKIFDEDKERPSIFVLHSYQMTPAEVDLLFTVARVVISANTGIYFRNIKNDLISVIED